jgi:hypothetical protein
VCIDSLLGLVEMDVVEMHPWACRHRVQLEGPLPFASREQGLVGLCPLLHRRRERDRGFQRCAVAIHSTLPVSGGLWIAPRSQDLPSSTSEAGKLNQEPVILPEDNKQAHGLC